MKNIIFFEDVPTPYRIKFLDELGKQLSDLKINLCFLAGSIKDRDNFHVVKFDYIFIKYLKSFNKYIKKLDIRITFPLGIHSYIKGKNPEIIVIGGYHKFAYWFILIYCRYNKIKIIIWSGTTEKSERNDLKLFRIIKRLFLSMSDYIISYGTDSTNYLVKIGCSKDKIINIINSTKFDKEIIYSKSISNQNILKHEINLLFVGRLIEAKGCEILLHALSKYTAKYNIKIIGDGPLKLKLIKLSNDLALSNVEFINSVNNEHMFDYYTKSDVFIFPSLSEVWGIVLNEALYCGNFCIASKFAGATTDLIINDFNGLVINPNNESDIISSLNYVKNNINFIRMNRMNRIMYAEKFSGENISKILANFIIKIAGQ